MAGNMNINEMSSRLQNLETEVKLIQRRQEEEAAKAESALKRITPQQVELLKGVVPEIAVVVNYTAEDILANNNGEVNMIRSVFSRMINYVSSRLEYYEAGLE